jgi:murein DD-endopeptidase MepM/ murein hydrolase activator NlpD
MRKTFALITAALGIFVLFASVQSPALAATGPKFLKLPFDNPKRIAIQRAWITRGKTGAFDLVHHAIDYVNGKRDDVTPGHWQPFDVMAAAAGEACGAKTNQRGCFDSGEIMGNRVLIKHKVDGETYYTFYNHLDTIADKIPLNNVKDTVHVDAGEVIGVAGASNSEGLLHLHWELLDSKFNPIDPYGIYGITDQYPDPRGKNGKLAKKKSYFIDNPPLAFGVVPKPTPGPSDEPVPTGPTESPGTSLAPGETPEPGASPGPGASAIPGSTPGPGASQIAIGGTPQPGATGGPTTPGSSSTGGTDVLPLAIGIGAVVAVALLGGLTLLSRRRARNLPPPRSNWRP